MAARFEVALDGGGREWPEGRASGGLKDVLATLELRSGVDGGGGASNGSVELATLSLRSGVDVRSCEKNFIENKQNLYAIF